jgi:hypothetical protein
MVIDTSFAVGLPDHADAGLRKTVAMFLNDLRRHTGMLPLDFSVTAPGKAQLVIHGNRPSKEVLELGEDESYTLEVNPSGGELSAPTTSGAWSRGPKHFCN